MLFYQLITYTKWLQYVNDNWNKTQEISYC